MINLLHALPEQTIPVERVHLFAKVPNKNHILVRFQHVSCLRDALYVFTERNSSSSIELGEDVLMRSGNIFTVHFDSWLISNNGMVDGRGLRVGDCSA